MGPALLPVRLALSALLAGAFLCACDKEDLTKDLTKKTKTFEVREGGTNTPLSGVQVKGFKCLERDLFKNCLRETFVSTATTDERGLASFPEAAEVSVLKVSKERYWDNVNYFHLTSSSVTYLYPKATLKVRFIKTNQYAAGERLIVVDQKGLMWDELSVSKKLGLPVDTTVYLQGRGNFENRVNWIVVDVNGNGPGNFSPGKMVSRFDTTEFEIRY